MKHKICRECKFTFEPRTSLQVCCNPVCALVYTKKKKAAKQKKANAKQKKDFKANDIPAQLKLTQTAFNKMRKLQEIKWFEDRGLEPECISCGKTKMDWCCGHFKTVGSCGALRFSEKNTYLQCNRNCNKGKSGNIHGNKAERGFIQGLKERFGAEVGAEIIEWCDINQSKVKKWNGVELGEMRRLFNKQIRELESGRLWDAIRTQG